MSLNKYQLTSMRLLFWIILLHILPLSLLSKVDDFAIYQADYDVDKRVYFRYFTREHMIRYVTTDRNQENNIVSIFKKLKRELIDCNTSDFGKVGYCLSFDSVFVENLTIVQGQKVIFENNIYPVEHEIIGCNKENKQFFEHETIEFLLNSDCFADIQEKHLRFNKKGQLKYLEINCQTLPVNSYRIYVYHQEYFTKSCFDYQSFIRQKIIKIEYKRTEEYANF